MRPFVYNIVIKQGETFNPVMTLFTDDQGTVPLDLTGYTAKHQCYQSGTLLIDFSSYITLGGVAGTLTYNVPSSITKTLTSDGTAYHDLYISSSGGIVDPIAEGTLMTLAKVTTLP